ncbi:MAG: glycosyltransferase [Solirubrobacteraceae bacterium]
MLSEPSISVVLTARNAACTIDDQLAALARQTVRVPWELVVVDNGSSDETAARVQAWTGRLPSLRLLDGPSTPAGAASLNAGVAAADADRLAFCDADDVVSDGWVQAMCQALSDHGHVAGPIDLARLNPPELVWGEHVAAWRVGPVQHSFLPFAMTCNAGWRRDVLQRVGGFWEHLRSGYDRDLSWRTQLAGHGLWFEGAALVHRRQRQGIRATARQHLSYGRNEPNLIARFAPHGIRPRSARESARAWAELTARLPWLLSPHRRIRWVETAGLLIGRSLPLTAVERDFLRRSLADPDQVATP